ncbi:MAG: DUF72 domain-containing protein [Burkholderiales bacterium]|nr:DUF72 domain-containing protein [Burkholderiales bacterium]
MPLHIGTASWAAASLIRSGDFYPAEACTPESRLRYYAARFDLAEVDASYYAIPTPSQARAWAQRTPEGFVFNLKAFRLFTGHAAPPQALPADMRAALGERARVPWLRAHDLPGEVIDELWRRFLDMAAPLREAGRLGALHFQFAPGVTATPAGRRHVADCVRRVRARAGHRMAVEFRHRSWFAQREAIRSTLAFEQELDVAHVVVDSPFDHVHAMPQVWAVTDPSLAVLRLHGRNPANWGPRGAASGQRFNYDYADDELAALTPDIAALMAQAQAVHVVFNNNHDSQGQRNARTLAALMGVGP